MQKDKEVIDKIARDTKSLLGVGWDIEKIALHLCKHKSENGNLTLDEYRDITSEVCTDLNEKIRRENAESRKVINETKKAINAKMRTLGRSKAITDVFGEGFMDKCSIKI